MNRPKSQPKPRARPKPPTPPKPICRVFTTNNQTIHLGESATLKYVLTHADYAEISSIGSVNPRGGSVQVSPTISTDYILQAQNRYGYGLCPNVHITVLPKDSVSDNETIFGDSTIMSCSPNTVAPGASAIVLWQCGDNAKKSVGSSTEYGEFTTYGKIEGSVRVAPSETSKFVVRCRDSAGREVGRSSCKVQVGGNTQISRDNTQRSGNSIATPHTNLSASKRRVSAGDTVTISWEGFNTDDCTITGPDGFRELGNKGSVTGRMLQTSTFELDCNASSRAVPTKSVTITAI